MAASELGGSAVIERDYAKLESSAHHLNSFILHVRVTTKDVVLLPKFNVGITDFDGKARRPEHDHAYVQAKLRSRVAAVALAERAFDLWERRSSEVPPPRPQSLGNALADFDGSLYGSEYLSMTRGDAIRALTPPAGIETAGWGFGDNVVTGCGGWYPPEFVA